MKPATYARPVTADHDWDDYYQWSDSEREEYAEDLEKASKALDGLGDFKGAKFLSDLAGRALRSRKVKPIWSDAQQRWLDSLIKKVQLSTPEGREVAKELAEQARKEREEIKKQQQQQVVVQDLDTVVKERFAEIQGTIKSAGSTLRAHGWAPSSKAYRSLGNSSFRTTGANFTKEEGSLEWALAVVGRTGVDGGKVAVEFSALGSCSYPDAWRPRGGTTERFGKEKGYNEPDWVRVREGDALPKALQAVLADVLDDADKLEKKATDVVTKQTLEVIAQLEKDLGALPPEAEKIKATTQRGILVTRADLESLQAMRRKTAHMPTRVMLRHLYGAAPKRNAPDSIVKFLVDKIGVPLGIARRIGDAVYRGRDLDSLSTQQGWPVEESGKGDLKLKGDKDEISLFTLSTFRTQPIPAY